MRDRFTNVATDLLLADKKAVVVLAALGASSFTDAPSTVRSRIIDVGIREQAMIGVAGGLALEGFRPIVMSYTPFLVERPFEQIKLSLTHQGVHATLVSIGGSWDASTEGRTHQAPEDVAVMSTLPGWTIHVPGTSDEAEQALRLAHDSATSHYIRLSGDQNAASAHAQPGVITILRRGSDHGMTVLAVGPVADAVLEAVEGTDATVLYTNVPRPIDADGLRASVVGSEIVVVEPYLVGSSVPPVAAALSDRPMRIRAIGVTNPELAHYGTPRELRAAHGLDADGLRAALEHGIAQIAS
ncbi:MAG: transketolase [Armatimonadetes bacterium]|nr:MAG: transketolase [Armatimonadota bacterium]